MNTQKSYTLKLLAAVVLLMLIFIEFVCIGLYKLNPNSVFDWRHYPEAFAHTQKSNLAYGWSNREGLPRPDYAESLPICARAFGDSFTYGEEVEPQDTWANIASIKLGCRIENYGVGGFGTDQALILYESTNTHTPVVLLGIYSEMLRRNLAASWLFYGGQKGRALKPYFELTPQGKLQQIPWPRNATTSDIRAYHSKDIFFDSYDLKFPYFLHMSKSVFFQLKTRLENKGIFFDKHAKVLPLQLAILDEFSALVTQRRSELVLVYYPSLAELANNRFSYSAQLEKFKAKHPHACIIDTGPALLTAVKKGISVGAPAGHFDTKGNEIVASVVVDGLKTCENTKKFFLANAPRN